MTSTRLDSLLFEKRLAESRSMAQRLIMAGQVRVDGQVIIKPAHKVNPDVQITISQGPKFVSRGGEKLEAALIAFNRTSMSGKVCADVGASTGGFSDCLLQYGAVKIFAIDVGYGILHWKLRNDPRIVVMERTNARDLSSLPEIPDLITVDTSFISLKIILPVVKKWFFDQSGEVIALIKPQFEAGKKDAARGEGVIRDPIIHKRVLVDVLTAAEDIGFGVNGLIQSPLKGPKGNIEFLVFLCLPKAVESQSQQLIEKLFPSENESTYD